MKIVFPLIFSSSLAFGQWQPAPPADPMPTPYPGGAPDMQIAINGIRERVGVPQIVSMIGLDCAAQKHAEDLAKNKICNHEGTQRTSFPQRAESCGEIAHAEIIACGFSKAEYAVRLWSRDRRSYDLMVSDESYAMGSGNSGDVWVVLFRR